jgi:nicotinamide-nucleotide amidase
VDAPPEHDFAGIIAELAGRLLGRSRQLVTAESCTGGWVAKACTDRPGSSQWYRGGVVAYSNELKVALLGVRPRTLEQHGAVSEAVVQEMAAGALQWLGGDVAVSVSGVAGPDGGTPDKPVGSVWFAWAERGDSGILMRSALRQFDGDRDRVRGQAVLAALQGLIEA